jgi:putative transferase (TIGR04331 family)
MPHLALSSNKDFWNKSFKNIYLGPWIMHDVLKDNFSEYDLIIPDWHWDNLDKFYKDSLIVWKSYEKFIIKLAEVLNELHDVNWNLRAWKILVGPWFRRYLSILYERNETINNLYKSYDLRSCTIKNFSITDLQVKDFDEFSAKYHKEDFNNIIYSYILKKIDKEKKINFKELNFETQKKINKYKKNKDLVPKKNFKNFLLSKNLNFLTSFFLKKNNYYFHNIYTKNIFELIKLNLKLKNFPSHRLINSNSEDEKKFDEILRNKFYEKVKKKFDIEKGNLYEELIVNLIYQMFPRCYLENFKINKIKAQNIFKYFNPKIIIDSTSYHKDELFKFWVAEKIQKSSKLVLLQHGGYYENFKFKDDFLGHELDIADKYLSWGWYKKPFNISPVGISINFEKKFFKKENNIVNIIMRTAGDYFINFSTQGNPSKNSETYINNVINIANNINKDKKLRIFLHPSNNQNDERGYPLKLYLKKKIINKNTEFLQGKISEYINYTDMNIFTYLGTPYNQAISSDIPCLIYHDETYEPLNEDYRQIYNSMINAKLMYNNVISLTKKINNDSESIYNWWNQKNTVVSKNLFCKTFARKEKNKDKLSEIISNMK